MTEPTLKDVVASVKEQVPNVVAIYLSGSRLNNLNIASTDYDLFAITKPTAHSILSGQHYVHHASGKANGVELDIKIYDTLKFLQVIIKANPNTAELFYREPLFVSSDFAPIARQLGSEEMLKKMLAINAENFVHAIGGQVKQEGKSFVLGNVQLKRQSKIVVQTSKFERYLSELVEYGVLKTVLKPTKRELDIRYKAQEIELSESLETSIIQNKNAQAEFRQELLREFEQISAKIESMVTRIDDGEIQLAQEEINYEEFMMFLLR